MTTLTLYINNNTEGSPTWVDVDLYNDEFIFTAGGSGVADGEDIPTEGELNRAAVQLSETVEVVVSKYLLSDYSADLLKEIKTAGNQNTRYAFKCTFDGATATEPQLEAWDNIDMSSYVDPSLGSGTPSNSWYKAVCTTTSSPGSDWTGTPLAGSGASNIVLLNDGNGAIVAAGDLYFNFKIIIPAGYVIPAQHIPIILITYTTN